MNYVEPNTAKVCDGKTDCPNGEDEDRRYCDLTTCDKVSCHPSIICFFCTIKLSIKYPNGIDRTLAQSRRVLDSTTPCH